jgi:hypothetical protein
MANAQSAQSTDWLKSQQQYWDSWFEQQRKFFGGSAENAANSQEPWTAFFKEWQNIVGGATAAPQTDAFQQYFAKAGESYTNMLQQFYQATGQAKPLDQMAQEWTENLQKFYANAFQTNSQPFDFAKAWNPGAAGGKDFFSGIDPLGFFASMPGIGYTREKQEQLNHLYQQWAAYEEKSRAYNAGMAKVGMEAVQKFQAYLANPPKEAQPLKSLKEIYTKWVDVCEDIYARYAMTEEYTSLYGEVVNALMAFKKQQNKATDDMLDQFNLPTRVEVDSLHERLHALRRDNLQLKKDIAALKAALKPQTVVKSAAKPVAKKTAKKGKKK